MRTSPALAPPVRRTEDTTPTAALPEAAVHGLRQVIRALARETRAASRGAEPSVDLDLDQPALDVLAHVVGARRAYPAEISQRLRMEDDVVERAACELQQLGLLVPIADVAKPTGLALVPTAMGRRVLGEGAEAGSDALATMLTGWSLEDVDTLTRLLARLTRSGRSSGSGRPEDRDAPADQACRPHPDRE